MNNQPTCATCKYLSKYHAVPQCRRYPPTLVGLQHQEARFPHIRSMGTDWCGEHKAAE
jgi:hypothetical protein